MAQTSPPKHASALGERLNAKMEADLSEAASLMQKKLEKLANDSSNSLKSSLHTAVSDIQEDLQNLRRIARGMFLWSAAASVMLVVLTIFGLWGYIHWKLDTVEKLRIEKTRLETMLQSLPQGVHLIHLKGVWYVEAPSIQLGYTVKRNGKTLDAAKLQP
ncbi:hypothetical protein [Candidatus Igneacidithiobacillus taiwanensis]|uniref:hypothetical protein n=1 Tax=Candidatus Igneacidithiobacillus taiwanensis TaxID=1945924 RepID=UPI002899E10E|nr:hypothetical protein [Candidatus Igneacidithiobacillus taiwanensis]